MHVDSPRVRRLRSDLKALSLLQQESNIFSFEATGSPPEFYVLRFKGRGVFRPENSSEVRIIESHEVALRLGAGYPRQLPGLTWKTPIFHPNIAQSGVVCLGTYGQHWAPSVTIDELCHMLWDMIRYANYDVESPYNREAAQWAKQVEAHRFPLDARPLRDITASEAKLGLRKTVSEIPLKPPSLVPQPHRPPPSPEVVFLDDDDVVDAEVVESAANRVSEDEGIMFIN